MTVTATDTTGGSDASDGRSKTNDSRGPGVGNDDSTGDTGSVTIDTSTKQHGNIIDSTGDTGTVNVVCDVPALCKDVETEVTDPEEVTVEPVTLQDVASFHPVTGATGMEPDGWMVIGLAANFYSGATQHVVAGQILGNDAEVQFTPVVWHWDYGDGSTRDSREAGGSWDSQGLDEFDATPTSHVFTRAGDYDIHVSIEYRAEYRYATGAWTPIPGSVRVDGDPLAATAGTAKTVLVGAECGPDSSAPGC